MNRKNYEQILTAENHILEKGYVCYEDLIQVVEYRPWVLKALADCIRTETFDLQPHHIRSDITEGMKYSAKNYFKAVNQFLLRNAKVLPVGLFNEEVYVN